VTDGVRILFRGNEEKRGKKNDNRVVSVKEGFSQSARLQHCCSRADRWGAVWLALHTGKVESGNFSSFK
jgi:hypothetical protein